MQNPIIVLSGPTASGKTAMSFELANQFNGEIIAVDSMTVYRGMDIGTDKPTLLNKKLKIKNTKNADGTFIIKGIRHHLLDIAEPNKEINAAILKEKIAEAVKKIHANGKIPFLVGGSALYLDTFIYDFKMPEVEPDQDLRKELEEKTVEELFAELVELDPDCEWTIDRNNKRRVIRALEVVKKTGQPFCAQKSKSQKPANILYLAVQREREELYAKINKRVDEMVAEGLLAEVDVLYKKYDHNTAMQAAGYKQFIEYLDNKISLEEAIEKTKQIHRNFAKRQMTWFKKNPDIIWISDVTEATKAIEDFFSKSGYNFK